MKKFLLLIIMLVPFNVFAIADKAKSNILIEASTGTILYQNESEKELAPASMTKMMTLLIVMEKLEDKTINLNDKVMISESASSMGGSQVFLSAGSVYDLETLIKAVCIGSANDAAYALAEHISGSTLEFVKLMNKRAKELGLKHTNFKNVHGLDEEGHYSSAHDMAFIAKELLKHESILKYTSTYEDYINHPNGSNTWIVNTNKLINYYDGLDGLKTGYTKESGYCITATAKKGNMRLISVVMGEETNQIRNQETMELLNYGYSNFKVEKIVDKNEDLGTIKIKFGKKEEEKIILKDDVIDLVNKGEKNKYTYEVKKDKVVAPVFKGDIVGTLITYADDKKIGEYDLVIANDINKANFFDYYKRNLRSALLGFK